MTIDLAHFLHHREEVIERLFELCGVMGIEPKLRGHHMDVLATIAAIQTAVNALKAASTTPTTNFATSDVQSALTSLAGTVGATVVETTPPAAGS